MGRSQLNCHCGGRFYRVGVTLVPAGTPNRGGFTYCHDTYDTIDPVPGVATYRCNKCDCTRQQKLRVSSKKKSKEKP